MSLVQRSGKPIKLLTDLIGEKEFFLPRKMANEVDPETGKSALMVCVNAKKTFIPIEESTPISFDNFCLLRDVGIFSSEANYSTEPEFNPFKNELP